ncbi:MULTISPECIES: peptidase T [Empedobacter]|uniref:Peptidase T n=1 Tax=Empedobacter falsenii TaxID=343874 RepID=A0A376GG79_9FLAO|nr:MULTISPECIES: peptidase T [Empedobacter]MBW1618734.1 peptidase T [Empedobacter falsenii]MDH0660057.1 peptidase T [Empedobacter sp. GD03865]MDH0675503.1 peptidase T [Empedobacter sp. GD03861]MDH1603209.1 peptidase T [Empedobacter sp. GD03739]MDH2206761.1 peptidase T [Empedobacter sp. GD03644]
MQTEWREKLVTRFLKYVKTYTESEAFLDKFPSTDRQWDLANYLVEELKQIGLEDVSIDENGYVFGYVPSTVDHEVPTIGFVSHMDTSPDFSGENVQPQIWENYDGGDIKLNESMILSPNEFPELSQYKGQTIITTDGTTLLGADDKAGVAEIVTAAEYLIAHPEIKHGRIAIGFTPDEEVGRGADFFNVEKFGAEWGYTMDGSEIGELEYENFNAASGIVTIKGKSVHPGYAKDKMINASNIAMEFAAQLPNDEVPELTDGREGFFHLAKITGNVSEAKMVYIIRDHDMEQYEARKALFLQIAADIQERFDHEVITAEVSDQYFNMIEKVKEKFQSVEIAEQALKDCGVTPNIKPIRGGTDGARLSFMGLPCPNIFAGGHNFHGPYEYVPVESMEKATEIIVRIAELTAEGAK